MCGSRVGNVGRVRERRCAIGPSDSSRQPRRRLCRDGDQGGAEEQFPDSNHQGEARREAGDLKEDVDVP